MQTGLMKRVIKIDAQNICFTEYSAKCSVLGNLKTISVFGSGGTCTKHWLARKASNLAANGHRKATRIHFPLHDAKNANNCNDGYAVYIRLDKFSHEPRVYMQLLLA